MAKELRAFLCGAKCESVRKYLIVRELSLAAGCEKDGNWAKELRKKDLEDSCEWGAAKSRSMLAEKASTVKRKIT